MHVVRFVDLDRKLITERPGGPPHEFLQNRDHPEAFEPPPGAVPVPAAAPAGTGGHGAAVYSVRVNGKSYTVEVAESGQLTDVQPAAAPAPVAAKSSNGDAVKAVLAGNIFKLHVAVGDAVDAGQPLLVVEAMKMETAVVAPKAGTITDVYVAEGDTVAVGDSLVAIG